MKKPIVFLDLDGVLADFVGGVAKLYGTTKEDLEKIWEPGIFSIHHSLGLEKETDIWAKIDNDPDFWVNLEPLPWADELIAMARSKNRRMVIATTPSLGTNSASGKVAWMKKYFGNSFRDYALIVEKSLLARNETMLIDDSPRNCFNFIEAGGWSCIFPQIWNDSHNYLKTGRMEHVVRMFDKWGH